MERAGGAPFVYGSQVCSTGSTSAPGPGRPATTSTRSTRSRTRRRSTRAWRRRSSDRSARATRATARRPFRSARSIRRRGWGSTRASCCSSSRAARGRRSHRRTGRRAWSRRTRCRCRPRTAAAGAAAVFCLPARVRAGEGGGRGREGKRQAERSDRRTGREAIRGHRQPRIFGQHAVHDHDRFDPARLADATTTGARPGLPDVVGRALRADLRRCREVDVGHEVQVALYRAGREIGDGADEAVRIEPVHDARRAIRREERQRRPERRMLYASGRVVVLDAGRFVVGSQPVRHAEQRPRR